MSENRLIIAGTNSGCGKTTVTCALLAAFKSTGYKTAPFKCGPDYIDPMFHRHITGRPSINLDSFFLDGARLKRVLKRRLCGCDIGIIEGVMGLYDGIGTDFEASAFDIAVKTGTPVILVVNAKGMALSLAALIYGYKKFASDLCGCGEGESLIKGVILNNVGPGMAGYLKKSVETMTGVKVVGCFENQKDAVLKSRHLGLVTAEEIKDLDEKVKLLGEAAKKTIDLEALMSIAAQAEPLENTENLLSAKGRETAEFVTSGGTELSIGTELSSGTEFSSGTELSIGTELFSSTEFSGGIEFSSSTEFSVSRPLLAVAMDKAFCFYYEENFQLFKDAGIDIAFFSPLNNEPVPKGASGLYLGGGYPELYAERLSKNEAARLSVAEAFHKKMPMIAECGGFMYLHEAIETLDGDIWPMCGVISGRAKMTGKLGPFGYIDIELQKDGLLGRAGQRLKGHEFHYSVSENGGGDFNISKRNDRKWTEGYSESWLYAGYPHLYLPGFVESALFFKDAMIKYHKREKENVII